MGGAPSPFRQYSVKQRVHVLFWTNKSYINLGEWEGVFLRVKVLWLRLKALGMPRLQTHSSAHWTGSYWEKES